MGVQTDVQGVTPKVPILRRGSLESKPWLISPFCLRVDGSSLRPDSVEKQPVSRHEEPCRKGEGQWEREVIWA